MIAGLVLLASSRLARPTRRHVSIHSPKTQNGIPSAGGVGSRCCHQKKGRYANVFASIDTSILDPIWDITQMATSIICCCAPVFPAVFAGIRLPKPLSSLFSSLRSSKGRSAAGTDDGKGGTWVPMSASNHNLAWTQVSAAHHNNGQPADGYGYHKNGQPTDGYGYDTGSYHRTSDGVNDPSYPTNPSYPMKVVEVRQDVEFV